MKGDTIAIKSDKRELNTVSKFGRIDLGGNAEEPLISSASTEVYMFDEVPKDNLNKNSLGGKGYGLAVMTKLGLPVPLGMIITTKMFNEFFSKGKKLWPELKDDIASKVSMLEARTGKRFNDAENPLLVSVRSGAPFSMPGMMDTVLNLGINDNIAQALARKTKDPRFAYDTYRRFIQLFGKIVMSIPGEKFDSILEEVKKNTGAKTDIAMTADGWKKVVKGYKALVKSETGKELTQDPMEQLFMAVSAVFNSWMNNRAIEYRKIYKIDDTMGTAVSIVMMVYGNFDDKSGSGVVFTRNPSTGENVLYGEFLGKAQGEDVVAGIRTPLSIEQLGAVVPEAYKELQETAKTLEKHFRDMQDIEFTIEGGKLYMLQTRTGKRAANAAVKVAMDMVAEGLINREEAVLRVDPDQLQRMLYKQIDPKAKAEPIAKGLPASPGAATGKVVFTVADAQAAKQRNESIILVRPETAPEDIAGIAASEGVLTSRGGMTSHAAVVTRGMGKPCIAGAGMIHADVAKGIFTVNGMTVKKGDIITIDGGSGMVYLGEMTLVIPKITGQVTTLLEWADGFKRLGVRANADTVEMAKKARENGAQGIGLARTERMFNAPDRRELVQKMILADGMDERMKYLDIIKPLQKEDFKGIFNVMTGLPVTIRLLDIPLHEFLPNMEEILPEVVVLKTNGKDQEKLKEKEKILSRVIALKEINPMMGQRGVRLGLMHSEIYRMQVGAIFDAASEMVKEGHKAPEIEIMIPQVAAAEELRQARKIVEDEATDTMNKHGVDLKYKVGSMIETPRAALTAQGMAKVSDFFSFGTNDLTQATFAFSRDDVETKFIPHYLENKVLDANPFETLDSTGVGRLVSMCATEGKESKPTLKIGICGEHGGDPRSIEFFNTTKIDYVSCSPYRIPVARLVAAQAELKKRHQKPSTA